MRRWYVVQVKSNQEALAGLELKEQGFRTFCPKYIKTTPRPAPAITKLKATPLFSGYLFVQFDIKKAVNWPAINGTRGVIGLVGFSGKYLTPIPKGCVEALIKRTDKKGFLQLEDAVSRVMAFTAGMAVLITEGTFKGQLATYCNHSANRVTLLIALLGKPLNVILTKDAIAPAPISG